MLHTGAGGIKGLERNWDPARSEQDPSIVAPLTLLFLPAMKFGKCLRGAMLHEWRAYYINYKLLKQCINAGAAALERGDCEITAVAASFCGALEEEAGRMLRFIERKGRWLQEYAAILELRAAHFKEQGQFSRLEWDSSAECSADEGSSDDSAASVCLSSGYDKRQRRGFPEPKSAPSSLESLHSEYMYAFKTLMDVEQELVLFERFLELNQEAVRKIVKKADKRLGTSMQASFMLSLKASPHGALLWADEATPRLRLKIRQMRTLIATDQSVVSSPVVSSLTPTTKVYTVGCFDLFHRGHQSMLMAMREFGTFVCVGIHDDESYHQLKGSYPVDRLPVRLAKVKQWADQVFVIPDRDPSVYLDAMVSSTDVTEGLCSYVRGEVGSRFF